MKTLAAWVLRSGDVIEWDGDIWAVKAVGLASARTWGEVTIRLKRVDDKREHTLYAEEDDKFPAVRRRGARYTSAQYRELIEGGFNGPIYG